MLRTLAVCCVCLLFAPREARAEWHFTPLLGATFAGSTTLYEVQSGSDKRHINFGGAVSRFGAGIIGVEGVVIYSRHFFEFTPPRDPADPVAPAVAKSYTLSATGNVVLTVPKRWTEYFLRPYVSAGFGLLRAVSIDQPPTALQSATLYPIHSTMPAFDVGGGAIGFLSQGTGVRFDVRYHEGLRRKPGPGETLITPDLDLHLHYMTAEIGLVIRR
jgi:hypothetical protein